MPKPSHLPHGTEKLYFPITYWWLGFIGLFTAVWVVLLSLGPDNVQRQRASQKTLAQVQALISLFLDDQGKTPMDLTELWAFAKARGRPLQRFDAFGQRLDYLRLSDKHFILRSFGNFDRGNLPRSSQLVLSRVSDAPAVTAKYDYPALLKPSIFPSPLALGTTSPDNLSHAQIYVDPSGGQKRLVVRSSARSDAAPLVSKHDGVEEFFWLPTGKEIVYTSTGSARYSDGIYLWNLSRDETRDLSREMELIGRPVADSDQLLLSLSGVSSSGRELAFFMAARAPGAGISPQDFFSERSFFVIQFSDKMSALSFGRKPQDAGDYKPILNPPFEIFRSVKPGEMKDQVFKEWAGLRFEGVLRDQLEAWQEFVMKRAGTPVFPYGLWFLASIYADVARVMAEGGFESSEQMRAYSVELFKALADYELAPSYLQAFAEYGLSALSDGWKLDYQLSRFVLAKDESKKDIGWREPQKKR